jgi:hypothetical protein
VAVAVAVAAASGSSADSVGGGGASLPRSANTANAPPAATISTTATMISRRAIARIVPDGG